MTARKVVILGSGNAALCAGISALEQGAEATILEKTGSGAAGGNSRYTAGAMRFAYESVGELTPLLRDLADERLPDTDFGSYPGSRFEADLEAFNGGKPVNILQKRLVLEGYATLRWLRRHNVAFEPIYDRQSFKKDGRFVFWGGLVLAAAGEGPGLVDAELQEFERIGGKIRYHMNASKLLMDDSRVVGVRCEGADGVEDVEADAVVLGCGGFEANRELRRKYMGEKWVHAKVRGTPHNTGAGLRMALAVGADRCGRSDGCHAVPMDLHMPDYGNLELSVADRKHYRKICYFLGVMLNAHGNRFVDEGENFRNYTYAQFGRAILDQPNAFAWQIFDRKVDELLYEEYRFEHASFVAADSLEELVPMLAGVDQAQALRTVREYNDAVDHATLFDPSVLDGRRTNGLAIDKTNWANTLDSPPFKAFPVTCGITFTYSGVRIDEQAAVLDWTGERIPGLFACGEIVGGVFFDGYPGGSGLTSGAVFGRIAGRSAATSRCE